MKRKTFYVAFTVPVTEREMNDWGEDELDDLIALKIYRWLEGNSGEDLDMTVVPDVTP